MKISVVLLLLVIFFVASAQASFFDNFFRHALTKRDAISGKTPYPTPSSVRCGKRSALLANGVDRKFCDPYTPDPVTNEVDDPECCSLGCRVRGPNVECFATGQHILNGVYTRLIADGFMRENGTVWACWQAPQCFSKNEDVNNVPRNFDFKPNKKEVENGALPDIPLDICESRGPNTQCCYQVKAARRGNRCRVGTNQGVCVSSDKSDRRSSRRCNIGSNN